MFTIALTGGIASGKSTAAEFFARKNVTVIDADRIASDCVAVGTAAYQTILEHFGRKIIKSDDSINRALLKEIIFNDESERFWLESLLHPLIYSEIEKQCQNAASTYCIVVIPLLVETGTADRFDRICVVDIDENLQKKRLLQRDNIQRSLLQSILKSQAARQQRLTIADDVIINNGTFADLQQQVNQLHALYLQLASHSIF